MHWAQSTTLRLAAKTGIPKYDVLKPAETQLWRYNRWGTEDEAAILNPETANCRVAHRDTFT